MELILLLSSYGALASIFGLVFLLAQLPVISVIRGAGNEKPASIVAGLISICILHPTTYQFHILLDEGLAIPLIAFSIMLLAVAIPLVAFCYPDMPFVGRSFLFFAIILSVGSLVAIPPLDNLLSLIEFSSFFEIEIVQYLSAFISLWLLIGGFINNKRRNQVFQVLVKGQTYEFKQDPYSE